MFLLLVSLFQRWRMIRCLFLKGYSHFQRTIIRTNIWKFYLTGSDVLFKGRKKFYINRVCVTFVHTEVNKAVPAFGELRVQEEKQPQTEVEISWQRSTETLGRTQHRRLPHWGEGKSSFLGKLLHFELRENSGSGGAGNYSRNNFCRKSTYRGPKGIENTAHLRCF